jgi:hypothetical protein
MKDRHSARIFSSSHHIPGGPDASNATLRIARIAMITFGWPSF